MLSISSLSLTDSPHNLALRRILSRAMEAADPSETIRAALRQRASQISAAQRIFLLSVGKASVRMAEAALPFVEDRLADGLIATKHASRATVGRVAVMEAGHPLPDARSLEAGRRAIELLSRLQPDDLLLCLLSGGASALMTAPALGISLEDLRNVASLLMKGGASIDELNLIRKRLDLLKGGGLALRAAPVSTLCLLLSDVVGDRLDWIASGPTVQDSSTSSEIERVLSSFRLETHLSSAVLDALRNEPKRGSFAHVENLLVGSNAQVVRAVWEQARIEGFRARVLTTILQGEAREAGVDLARTLRRARMRPLCLIAGGETTVTVRGEGKGGRNQELALAAALELDDVKDVMLISFATDGDDGTTGAAGAVVTGETISRARALGLDALDFLRRNDSHTFFAALDDLLVTGPTGTNVNDLVLMFKF